MLKKKIILSTLVLGACIAGITQGAWQGGNYTLPLEFTTNNSDIIIDENLNISNFSGGKIGLFKIQDYNNYIRWNEGKIYWYYNYGNTCRYQGEMDKMCIGALNQARNPTPVPGICTSNYSTETAEAFYNGEFGTEFETILVMNETNAQALNICFLDTTDNNTTYCLSAYQRTDKQLPCYTTFEDLQNNISAGESPFIPSGPGEEGGPIACRTINDMIKAYGKTYNTGMCYTPSITISGGQIVQTTPKSIFEIFSGFNQYQQLRTLYYNNCHTPYTQEHCINTMSGQEEAINFFNYIERTNQNSNYNVIAERLYQYCRLNLQFTDEEKETEGTCTLNNDNLYAPGITEETGNPSLIDSISNILDEELGIGIVTPTTGTVFDEFLEDGETRLEGISINRIKTFKEAYTKVMGLFKYRQTQEGIIPGYIVSLIAIIVLLALFKK